MNRPQYDSDSEGTDEFVASEEEEEDGELDEQGSEDEEMFAEVKNWGADLMGDAEDRRR